MPRIEAATVVEHHARQRERILDSAAALFTGRGIQGASMADIAQHAGLRRSSLYRYFESRDELVVALFQRDQVEYLERSNRILARHSPPLTRLLAWADFQLTYVVDPAHAIGNRLMHEAGALSPSATATIREGHRQLLHAVSDVIAQQLPDRGPAEREQLAEFVGATILAASRLAMERGAGPPLRRVLKRTLRAMLEA